MEGKNIIWLTKSPVLDGYCPAEMFPLDFSPKWCSSAAFLKATRVGFLELIEVSQGPRFDGVKAGCQDDLSPFPAVFFGGAFYEDRQKVGGQILVRPRFKRLENPWNWWVGTEKPGTDLGASFQVRRGLQLLDILNAKSGLGESGCEFKVIDQDGFKMGSCKKVFQKRVNKKSYKRLWTYYGEKKTMTSTVFKSKIVSKKCKVSVSRMCKALMYLGCRAHLLLTKVPVGLSLEPNGFP